MSNLWGDLRYAFRSLRKAPVFTAVAVLSLALGIGANTAIFSLLDQILLRLLPVKNAKELTLLTMRGRHYGGNWGGNAISYPMYRDFQDRNSVFSVMFCRFLREVSLTFDGHTELTNAELVSGTYFPGLGVGTALGRTFNENDDGTPSGHPLVVLSYDYWKTHFAGDPRVEGKKIVVNGNNFTIVGVAQEGFDGVELGTAAKIFIPVMMEQINNSLSSERLIASLSAVFGFLATVLATIGLYGVMAYTVARRTREIGIRMALGAARGNVVWMVMKEVLLLVALGVGVGLPAALAPTGFIRSQLFGIAPNDPATLAMATLGLVVVASASGYIPALRASRVDPILALRYE